MKQNTFKRPVYEANANKVLALIALVALFAFGVGFFAGTVCSLQ